MKIKTLQLKKNRYEDINIGIIIDNSKSIEKNSSIIQIGNILDSIEFWGNENNLNLYYYNLDSIITRDDLVFNNTSTNFDSFSKFSISNNLDQIILLSDGNINSGFLVNDLNLSKDMVVNTIGLGSTNSQNISIVDVQVDNFQDSLIAELNFNIDFNSYNQEVILNVFSDYYQNNIYTDTLGFIKGNYFFDKKIILNKSIKGDKLTFNLESSQLLNVTNNNWLINLEQIEKDKILLLTGLINYNTSFLKNILVSEFDLVHSIVFNNKIDDINFNDFDSIVLDNFPNSIYQLDILNKLYLLDIPIIFFEGSNSDLYYID